MIKKSRTALILIITLNVIPCNVSAENTPASEFSALHSTETSTLSTDSLTEIKTMAGNQFEEGFDKGVSGTFAGQLEGHWVVAGGCNFPCNPLDADSEKKYYQGIYEIDTASDYPKIVRKIGNLPSAMAYGGAVNYGKSLIIVGGANAVTSFTDVYVLSMDSQGDIVAEALPSLPYPADNFGLTLSGSRIYLAGGNIDGIPSNTLYVLDMEHLPLGWQQLPPFPGNPRVQPVVAASKDKQGRECIFIWGGFAGKGPGREATLNTDGYKFDVDSEKWTALHSPLNKENEEVSFGGGTSATLNDGRIAVAGGVNKDIFLAALKNQSADYLTHPAEWYKFNDRMLIFDPATEEWSQAIKDTRLARAGATLLHIGNDEVILIGGELKPRIRTTDIFKIKID